MKVHANINVGDYAWARFGFVPTQQSWDQLRESLNVWVNADDVSHDILGNEYSALKIPKRQRKALTKILNDPDPNRTWPIESSKEAKPLMFNGCKCEGLHYTMVARRPPNL